MTKTSSSILRIEKISKNFNGLKALSEIDLVLKQGEILGLIGPNGSGKTTLINIISGLLPASDGKIWLDLNDITNFPAHRVAHMGIARTFQTIRLFRELTVQENAEVAAVSVGASRKVARERAKEALTMIGIDHWAKLPAGTLPYGLERRVEIARALAMEPAFLLLDEPGAGLNEEESDSLLNTLKDIRAKRGVGMLVVEHDMRLIMRLCDRVQVLQSGKTIAVGSPAEVSNNPVVIEAYLGSKHKKE